MSPLLAERRELIHRLIREARQPCRSTLGQLLEEYREELNELADEFIGKRLRRRMAVSDLVQDTMLAAGNQFPSFRGRTDAEFRKWLLEIFHSRLVDGIRRHHHAERRRIGREEKSAPGDVADHRPTPSDVLSLEEDSLRVIAAINALPELQRQVLQMRYVQDLTFEDIALQTGLSMATVWRRWLDAISRIRAQVQCETLSASD